MLACAVPESRDRSYPNRNPAGRGERRASPIRPAFPPRHQRPPSSESSSPLSRHRFPLRRFGPGSRQSLPDCGERWCPARRWVIGLGGCRTRPIGSSSAPSRSASALRSWDSASRQSPSPQRLRRRPPRGAVPANATCCAGRESPDAPRGSGVRRMIKTEQTAKVPNRFKEAGVCLAQPAQHPTGPRSALEPASARPERVLATVAHRETPDEIDESTNEGGQCDRAAPVARSRKRWTRSELCR